MNLARCQIADFLEFSAAGERDVTRERRGHQRGLARREREGKIREERVGLSWCWELGWGGWVRQGVGSLKQSVETVGQTSPWKGRISEILDIAVEIDSIFRDDHSEKHTFLRQF